MRRRMSALRAIEKFRLTPINSAPSAFVNYETFTKIQSTRKDPLTTAAAPTGRPKSKRKLIQCSLCGCKLRADRTERHLNRAHGGQPTAQSATQKPRCLDSERYSRGLQGAESLGKRSGVQSDAPTNSETEARTQRPSPMPQRSGHRDKKAVVAIE
jgi:hypothetical protein